MVKSIERNQMIYISSSVEIRSSLWLLSAVAVALRWLWLCVVVTKAIKVSCFCLQTVMVVWLITALRLTCVEGLVEVVWLRSWLIIVLAAWLRSRVVGMVWLTAWRSMIHMNIRLPLVVVRSNVFTRLADILWLIDHLRMVVWLIPQPWLTIVLLSVQPFSLNHAHHGLASRVRFLGNNNIKKLVTGSCLVHLCKKINCFDFDA